MIFQPLTCYLGLTVLIHMPMWSGYQTYVMSKFDLEEYCANVQKYKATYSHVAPPIVLALARSPVVDKYDLSSLRMLNSGAAPLKPELVNALVTRIKTIGIKQGYGLSETSPTVSVGSWKNWQENTASAGFLMPNIEVRIMSVLEEHSEGERVELPFPGNPDQVGEIFVRGPNIFMGYLTSGSRP